MECVICSDPSGTSLPGQNQSGVKVRRCSLCSAVFYCSEAHQQKDWPRHRKWCQLIQFLNKNNLGMIVLSRSPEEVLDIDSLNEWEMIAGMDSEHGDEIDLSREEKKVDSIDCDHNPFHIHTERISNEQNQESNQNEVESRPLSQLGQKRARLENDSAEERIRRSRLKPTTVLANSDSKQLEVIKGLSGSESQTPLRVPLVTSSIAWASLHNWMLKSLDRWYRPQTGDYVTCIVRMWLLSGVDLTWRFAHAAGDSPIYLDPISFVVGGNSPHYYVSDVPKSIDALVRELCVGQRATALVCNNWAFGDQILGSTHGSALIPPRAPIVLSVHLLHVSSKKKVIHPNYSMSHELKLRRKFKGILDDDIESDDDDASRSTDFINHKGEQLSDEHVSSKSPRQWFASYHNSTALYPPQKTKRHPIFGLPETFVGTLQQKVQDARRYIETKLDQEFSSVGKTSLKALFGALEITKKVLSNKVNEFSPVGSLAVIQQNSARRDLRLNNLALRGWLKSLMLVPTNPFPLSADESQKHSKLPTSGALLAGRLIAIRSGLTSNLVSTIRTIAAALMIIRKHKQPEILGEQEKEKNSIGEDGASPIEVEKAKPKEESSSAPAFAAILESILDGVAQADKLQHSSTVSFITRELVVADARSAHLASSHSGELIKFAKYIDEIIEVLESQSKGHCDSEAKREYLSQIILGGIASINAFQKFSEHNDFYTPLQISSKNCSSPIAAKSKDVQCDLPISTEVTAHDAFRQRLERSSIQVWQRNFGFEKTLQQDHAADVPLESYDDVSLELTGVAFDIPNPPLSDKELFVSKSRPIEFEKESIWGAPVSKQECSLCCFVFASGNGRKQSYENVRYMHSKEQSHSPSSYGNQKVTQDTKTPKTQDSIEGDQASDMVIPEGAPPPLVECLNDEEIVPSLPLSGEDEKQFELCGWAKYASEVDDEYSMPPNPLSRASPIDRLLRTQLVNVDAELSATIVYRLPCYSGLGEFARVHTPPPPYLSVRSNDHLMKESIAQDDTVGTCSEMSEDSALSKGQLDSKTLCKDCLSRVRLLTLACASAYIRARHRPPTDFDMSVILSQPCVLPLPHFSLNSSPGSEPYDLSSVRRSLLETASSKDNASRSNLQSNVLAESGWCAWWALGALTRSKANTYPPRVISERQNSLNAFVWDRSGNSPDVKVHNASEENYNELNLEQRLNISLSLDSAQETELRRLILTSPGQFSSFGEFPPHAIFPKAISSAGFTIDP